MGHPLIRGRDRNWTGRFSRKLFSPDHFARGVARLKSCPDTKQKACWGANFGQAFPPRLLWQRLLTEHKTDTGHLAVE